MFPTAASAPAERLALILDMLCRAVAARGGRGWLAAPLVLLIWGRLRRLSARVLRLSARIGAGTPPSRPRRPRAPRPHRKPPPIRLPRGRAWLVRLVPGDAASAASQLRHLLRQPDMRALAAADPRMGRLLRPLCHMLGVAPSPEIAAPGPNASPAPASSEILRPLSATTPEAATPAPLRRAPQRLAPVPAPMPQPRPTACGPPPARATPGPVRA